MRGGGASAIRSIIRGGGSRVARPLVPLLLLLLLRRALRIRMQIMERRVVTMYWWRRDGWAGAAKGDVDVANCDWCCDGW